MKSIAIAALALALTCSCSSSDEPPRDAVGCMGPQLGVAGFYVVQDAPDGQACVRLEFAADGGGGSREAGIEVSGDLSLLSAFRVSESCADVAVFSMLPGESATPARGGSGEIRTTGSSIEYLDVTLEFGAAPDASMGPSSIRVVAADVGLSERCAR